MFPPGTSQQNTYFCIVENMQYIYIRDFIAGETTRRISLSHFPVCIAMSETNKIGIPDKMHPEFKPEDIKAAIPNAGKAGNYIVSVGTKEGKILVYTISNNYH